MSSTLPFPKQHSCNESMQCSPGCNDSECNRELPYPLKHPSDSWLAMHKDVIYDTTENWKRSEFRLRLGTIAINYDLGEDISKTTFGVKVAFKDKYGYPQIWRDLPFIQPDLTPYIQQIAEAISATLSASFVTHPEFNAAISALSTSVDNAMLSASGAMSAAAEAELCAQSAVITASEAKLSVSTAISIANEAMASAVVAYADAQAASQVAAEAKELAIEAAGAAEEAKDTSVSAKAIADQAMVSASIAYEKADSVQQIAIDAKDIAEDAKGIAKEAEKDASRAQDIADDAMWYAKHGPVSTDRLFQGNKINHLECGTSTLILD